MTLALAFEYFERITELADKGFAIVFDIDLFSCH
jgi:hypothetical protein